MKTPFTKNTKEARIFLESEGYSPLSFYMDMECVRPCISTWANINGTWKEKNYSTFNIEEEKEDWYDDTESSLEDFKIKVKQYESYKEA